MHVCVLSQHVDKEALASEKDVLCQVTAIVAALEQLNHRVSILRCSLDLDAIERQLRVQRPDVVFNLVESLADTDRLMPMVPWLLDAMGLPYSGCSANAILATNDKVGAKQIMQQAGLPTPAWLSLPRRVAGHSGRGSNGGVQGLMGRVIIKSMWEHASRGLDAASVVESDGAPATLEAAVLRRERSIGIPCFAEEFIDGRELSVSMLAGSHGPVILPPAEIDFSCFHGHQPKIVDYSAKWNADSFEFQNSPRRFEFPAQDDGLLVEIEELARRCWDLFGLQGYARVDFRIDGSGRPWILEVNANPCLSPDAGFAAATRQAGLSYKGMIQAILDDAMIIDQVRDVAFSF